MWFECPTPHGRSIEIGRGLGRLHKPKILKESMSRAQKLNNLNSSLPWGLHVVQPWASCRCILQFFSYSFYSFNIIAERQLGWSLANQANKNEKLHVLAMRSRVNLLVLDDWTTLFFKLCIKVNLNLHSSGGFTHK